MLNVLGQQNRVLRCSACGETDNFSCTAKEYHSWAVDRYGEFGEDLGCDESEQFHEFKCGNCSANVDWVDDVPEDLSPENENVLAGMRCPECKQNTKFLIAVEAMMAVTDDGTDPFDDAVNDKTYEWGDESYCRCPECGKRGPVSEFRS